MATALEETGFLQGPIGLAVHGHTVFWTDNFQGHVATRFLDSGLTGTGMRYLARGLKNLGKLAVFNRGPRSED